MNTKQVSTEAKKFYDEHHSLADAVATAGQRRYDAEQDSARARREYDRADDSYMRLRGVDALKNSIEYYLMERSNALSRLRSTEKRSKAATERERHTHLSYNRNLDASAEHYSSNADLYHEQAIQDAHEAHVDVDFHGDVAVNVRDAA